MTMRQAALQHTHVVWLFVLQANCDLHIVYAAVALPFFGKPALILHNVRYCCAAGHQSSFLFQLLDGTMVGVCGLVAAATMEGEGYSLHCYTADRAGVPGQHNTKIVAGSGSVVAR